MALYPEAHSALVPADCARMQLVDSARAPHSTLSVDASKTKRKPKAPGNHPESPGSRYTKPTCATSC